MPARYLSDLAGTLRTAFRVGVNKLENVAGILTSRTNAGVDAPIAASQAQLKGLAFKTTLAPAAAGQVVDLVFKLPSADGATNQAIVTDAAGNLSFASVALGANSMKAEDQLVAFNSVSPVTIVVLPAGATIQRVLVEVETAFDGAPSLSIGITGTPSKYMGTSDLDLSVAATYEVTPMVEEPTAVSPIVTYAAGAATVGSARVTVTWVLPG